MMRNRFTVLPALQPRGRHHAVRLAREAPRPL